jgi:hypothetical protein
MVRRGLKFDSRVIFCDRWAFRCRQSQESETGEAPVFEENDGRAPDTISRKTLRQAPSIHNKLVLLHISLPNEYEGLRYLHCPAATAFGGSTEDSQNVWARRPCQASSDVSPDGPASASGVHDLLNIVFLIHDLHVAFDPLKLAFEL